MNPHVLDRRSYKICRLRIKETKTFHEIAAIFNLPATRVEQIYRAAVRRIELRQRGHAESPEDRLSARARHALQRVLGTNDVTRIEVLQALKEHRLHPGVTQNYGPKTHQEICQWAGVSPGRLLEIEKSFETKNPNDWATRDEPLTNSQRRYLRSLYKKSHEVFEGNLTKAQASKRIAELQQKHGRGTTTQSTT